MVKIGRKHCFSFMAAGFITFVFSASDLMGGTQISHSDWRNQSKTLLVPDSLTYSNAYSPPELDITPLTHPKTETVSLHIRGNRVTVRLAPTTKTKRRGVVMKNAVLPILATARGPGCRAEWYRVHSDAWICGDYAVVIKRQPRGVKYPIVAKNATTPWPYAFVREDTLEYRFADGIFRETRDLLQGFGFGVAGKVVFDGQKFFKTPSGNLVPTEDAAITRKVSAFAGIEITDGKPWPVGFVNSATAWAYGKPSRFRGKRIGTVNRYTPFAVLERSGSKRKEMFRFDDNAWLSSRDVRVTRDTTPPAGLADGEKWVDVDTATQIVTAYEGAVPVYVTMASTGRKGPSKTIKGTFRIWVKVAAIAMDNTDDPENEDDYLPDLYDGAFLDEKKPYSLNDVPWTQFFYKSYALHGVYWHNRFGNRKSHGCVNLSPRDAKWFYNWTTPRLPSGFWALYASPNDKGTLIRVR